jgi:hypothetical protein
MESYSAYLAIYTGGILLKEEVFMVLCKCHKVARTDMGLGGPTYSLIENGQKHAAIASNIYTASIL